MILSLFTGAISPYYFAIIAWSILIVVSLIVEFVTDELTIIWGTVGAVCTLIATIFHAPIWLQFVIFFITTGLFILLTKPLIKKHNKKIKTRTNADRIIDMINKNPNDRRCVNSLWQDDYIDTAVLPSCVWSSEWDVTDGKLNCC